MCVCVGGGGGGGVGGGVLGCGGGGGVGGGGVGEGGGGGGLKLFCLRTEHLILKEQSVDLKNKFSLSDRQRLVCVPE